MRSFARDATRWLSVCVLLAASAAGRAQTIIASTIDPGGTFHINSGYNVTSSDLAAAAFHVGASSYTLTDVQAPFFKLPDGAGTVDLSLYTDLNGVPDNQGAPLVTMTNAIAARMPAQLDTFTPGANVVLNANTIYWLVASTASGKLVWSFNDQGYHGNAAQIRGNSGHWETVPGGLTAAYTVRGNPLGGSRASSLGLAPEGPSLLLMLAGICPLGLLLRRRR